MLLGGIRRERRVRVRVEGVGRLPLRFQEKGRRFLEW